MIDRVTGADSCSLTAKRFPRDSDARLNSGFVELNTHVSVSVDAIGAAIEWSISRDKKFFRGPIKVGLAFLSFGNRSHESPSHTHIQSEIAGYAPVILHKGAKHLPAPASGSSKKRLVMNRAERLSEQ